MTKVEGGFVALLMLFCLSFARGTPDCRGPASGPRAGKDPPTYRRRRGLLGVRHASERMSPPHPAVSDDEAGGDVEEASRCRSLCAALIPTADPFACLIIGICIHPPLSPGQRRSRGRVPAPSPPRASPRPPSVTTSRPRRRMPPIAGREGASPPCASPRPPSATTSGRRNSLGPSSPPRDRLCKRRDAIVTPLPLQRARTPRYSSSSAAPAARRGYRPRRGRWPLPPARRWT